MTTESRPPDESSDAKRTELGEPEYPEEPDAMHGPRDTGPDAEELQEQISETRKPMGPPEEEVEDERGGPEEDIAPPPPTDPGEPA